MTADVINLADLKPHKSGGAICSSCKHKWVAVAGEDVMVMECPECNCVTGHWLYPLAKGESYWKCNCENVVFHINEKGVYCNQCGQYVDLEEAFDER